MSGRNLWQRFRLAWQIVSLVLRGAKIEVHLISDEVVIRDQCGCVEWHIGKPRTGRN